MTNSGVTTFNTMGTVTPQSSQFHQPVIRMAQIRYTLSLSVGAQLSIKDSISMMVFPLLNQAVQAVAGQTAADWQAAVYKAKLWSGEKDLYAQSIKWEMTGNYSAVIQSGYKYAEEIETGRPPKDLKKMLDTSQKVRRTKDGRRFLVIPMRHNTGGSAGHAPAMPSSVYGLAKAMTPSRVTSTGKRMSGEITTLSPKTGMKMAAKQTSFLSNPKTKGAMMVANSRYAWGSRLTAGALKASGADVATAKRYAGMVKMNTSTPGGQSSAYMTFRIMMEGSSGWIIPAKPGLYLARNVAQQMQPKAQSAFMEAIKRSIGGS